MRSVKLRPFVSLNPLAPMANEIKNRMIKGPAAGSLPEKIRNNAQINVIKAIPNRDLKVFMYFKFALFLQFNNHFNFYRDIMG